MCNLCISFPIQTTQNRVKLIYWLTKFRFMGWREGSAVKSTCCSCKETKFNSQCSHGGSQLPVTISEGSDAFSWTAHTPGMDGIHMCTCKHNSPTQKIKLNKSTSFLKKIGCEAISKKEKDWNRSYRDANYKIMKSIQKNTNILNILSL